MPTLVTIIKSYTVIFFLPFMRDEKKEDERNCQRANANTNATPMSVPMLQYYSYSPPYACPPAPKTLPSTSHLPLPSDLH